MSRLVPSYVEHLLPYVPGKPVEELERELGIKNAVKLASNENPLGASPRVMEAIVRTGASLGRYPDAAAYTLREALAAHHDVSMDEIVIGNGSNELIDLACRTFAAPGDHAVIGNPTFICYRMGLLAANIDFSEVPLRGNLTWDVDAMLAAVRPETRLLSLVNPNNPTGAHVSSTDLARLLRGLPERVVVVVDEAYVEYADAPDFASALSMRGAHERLLVLRTFSKAYGLAALRVGYGIGPRSLIDFLDRVRAPFNTSAIGQIAARAALGDQAHIARSVAMNRTERARVSAALGAMSYTVAPTQANFVLVDFSAPGKDLYERLLRKGVIIRPTPPPLGTSLRITIGLPAENDRLLAAVNDLASDLER